MRRSGLAAAWILVTGLAIGLALLVSPREPAGAAASAVRPGPEAGRAAGDPAIEPPAAPVGAAPVSPLTDEEKPVPAQATGHVRLIVELVDPAVAAYSGGIAGLAPTSAAATGRRKLDIASAAAQRYITFLAARQAGFIAALRQAIPSATTDYTYQAAINAVAVEVPGTAVETVARLPGVKAVSFDTLMSADLYDAREIVGAPTAWATLGGITNAGSGIYVGIIDSGIVPTHTMFSGVGFAAPTPKPHWSQIGRGNFVCSAGDPRDFCNNKIVVARSYNQPGMSQICAAERLTSPIAVEQHGAHVAGIAAGNPATGTLGEVVKPISGIAPGAQLLVYKGLVAIDGNGDGICDGGSGTTAALLAALEDSLADGVDVVNNSWGSSGCNPDGTSYRTAIDNLVASGVVVVFSAGNNGPGPSTLGSPGCLDSALTVAASTKADTWVSPITLTEGITPLEPITGKSLSGAVGPTVVASAATDPYASVACRKAADRGTFSNTIVSCQRGSISRADKSRNVRSGDAVAVVVTTTTAGDVIRPEMGWLPMVQLDYTTSITFEQWLRTSGVHTATIGAAREVSATRDAVTNFSSRGPTPNVRRIKPDILAPGGSILSASNDFQQPPGPGTNYSMLSGTSMAAPVVAGAAALLAQAHPDWSARQIKSALMTSAWQQDLSVEESRRAATPFDVGSGRVDLPRALDPGVTVEPYPSLTFIAHVLDSRPGPAARTTISVTNVSTQTETYRVAEGRLITITSTPKVSPTLSFSPTQLTLAPGASAGVEVMVDATRDSTGQFFGQIELTGSVHRAHLPVYLDLSHQFDLTKRADRPRAGTGERITFTVALTNVLESGNTYTVTDRLPPELDLISETLSAGAVYNSATREIVWPVSLPGTVQTGTYHLTDSRTGGRGFQLIDLSTSGGTPLPCDSDCDDYTAPGISLAPRSIDFFGRPHAEWQFNTNGFIQPLSGTAPSGSAFPRQLPNPTSPTNLFAGLWGDLVLPGSGSSGRGGTWWYQVRDRVDPARPSDTFLVVQWKDADFYGFSSLKANFNILARTGSGGEICAVYGSPLELPAEIVIGIENSAGTLGATHYFNGAPPANEPAAGVTVCAVPVMATGHSRVLTYQTLADQAGRAVNAVTVALPNSLITDRIELAVSITPLSRTVTLPFIGRSTRTW